MSDNNPLHERRAAFNHDGAAPPADWSSQRERAQHRAKIFKSGNSLALRLPKALGLKEGSEMLISVENGRYMLEPVEAPRRTIDVSEFWGKAPGARLIPHGDFDERPSTIAARKAAEEASKAA